MKNPKKNNLSDLEEGLISSQEENHETARIARVKKIALIAHDNRKKALLEWASFNRELLAKHVLFATGTTGKILENKLDLPIHKFKSGPLGGDQQVGAKIAEGDIDFLIFFWDPLEAQPHDPDVKALLRLATVYNIPVAIDRSSADFIISSHLMDEQYDRILTDYQRRYKVT